MNNHKPDSPGIGAIHIEVDAHGTKVDYTNMETLVLAHLFYFAIKEIPNGYYAVQLAIDRINSEHHKN